jgi:hypothetical protein
VPGPPVFSATESLAITPVDRQYFEALGESALMTRESAVKRFSNGVAVEAVSGRHLRVYWGAGELSSADENWLIVGWGAALLALQQGFAVLHASCVAVAGRTFALVGRSGAGKSTTAVALSQSGHALLVDDVTVMSTQFESPQARPFVFPFERPVNLTQNSLNLLGIPQAAWKQMVANPQKGAVSVPTANLQPQPLDAIVVLDESSGSDDLQVSRLSTMSAFNVLLEHAGREGAAPQILGQDTFQRFVAHTVRTVPVMTITRPRGRNTIGAVVSLIESEAQQLENHA